MSARFGLRAAQQTFRQAGFRQQLNTKVRFAQKRYQTTTANAGEAAKNESYFTKLWNSEVGPKTVHFWAPIMKWGLVLAGASDFARPADQLSITQNGALMATGLIWTRWCFVIKPRNLFLASVNFLLFCVGATQVSRVLLHQRSLKEAGNEIKGDAKQVAGEAENAAKGVKEDVKQAAK